MKVKTPFGLTKSETIERIIMQGETFGPLCCSVQVDSFGKECLVKNKLLYQYKGAVGVPPLAMVDDMVCISKCGIQSVSMNAFINAKTNLKKLQFGVSKCHKMHIGVKKSYCPDLKVDNWEVKLVEDCETGAKACEDAFVGEFKIDECETEKYLGDHISSRGTNEKNIEERKKKGIGIISQLMNKLEGTVYGPYHFEVSLILRQSHLLSSILTNSEAWYGLKTSDIEQLEQVDESYLRRVLEVGISCPKEMLYLETGSTPIRFILVFRRLMFLHYILNEEPESLIHQCFDAQKDNPCRNDWILTVQEDLEELEIMLEFEEIKTLTNFQFKSFLKKIIEEKALIYLNNVKSKHSQVLHIEHKELRIQEYLEPKNITSINLAKFLFQARARMLDLKMNFRRKYKSEELSCPLECNELDTQQHLLNCQKIPSTDLADKSTTEYDGLFSKEVKKQVCVATILQERLKTRKKMVKAKS